MKHKRRRLGIEQTSQPLLLERAEHEGFRLWLHYNQTVTAGTYLHILPNGTVIRVTEQPTGEVTEYIDVAKL